MSLIELALVSVGTPAAAALLLAVVPALRNTGKPAAYVSIAAATASFAAALALLAGQLARGGVSEWVVAWMPGPRGPMAEVGVHVDGTSAVMLAVVGLVALCVQVFSVKYLEGEPDKAIGRYFTYQSFFIFSMGSLVVAPNLLQLFAGWELVGVTSYLLIGHYFRKPSAGKASLKAFWVTKLADVGLLFGLIALYAETGSFRWEGVGVTGALATTVTLLLFLAVCGKSAQFPLHVWLPDAMEGPTPVSALLHAATMVAAGVFLIVRAAPLFELAPLTGSVMTYVGAGTAVFAALLAVVQTDIKKMLAYSTCSQLGYMITALGAGSVMGGYFHLLTHAAFKALLFLAAGNLIHAVHSNELSHMGGLAKKMKFTAAAFVVGTLALAGVPGLSGGFSKDLILEAVAQKGLWVPFTLLMAGVPLTAFYMGRACLRAFWGQESEHAHHAHEAPFSMLLPLALLAVPTVLAGYFGTTLADMVGREYHFHWGVITFVAPALGFLGLFLAWAAQRGGAVGAFVSMATLAIGAVARGAWVNKVWEAGYRSGLQPVANATAWFDRYVVDALVNLMGWAALDAGKRVRVAQTGNVRDYLLVVASAVVLFVLWGVW